MNMMRSFNLIILLLLFGSSNYSVQANTDADYEVIITAVGGCFEDESADTTTTLSCLSDYTDCFDSNSVTAVKTCIQNANSSATSSGTRVTSEIVNCVEPYVTCITTKFQEIIDSLPACMNTTITDLGNCYIDNADTCNSTCSVDDIPMTNPYASASATSILLCRAFQSDIMDPTCAIVDCCQPCISKFETFMNCIAQDALNLKTAPPQSGDCVLSCPSRRRRFLGFVEAVIDAHGAQDSHRMLASHTATKLQAGEIYGLCAKFLETATVAASNGATIGSTPPVVPAELASNIVEGHFQKCVVEKLLQLTTEYAGSSTSPAMAHYGGGSLALVFMTTTLFAVMASLVA